MCSVEGEGEKTKVAPEDRELGSQWRKNTTRSSSLQCFFPLASSILLLLHHLKPTFPLCLLQLSIISHDRWAWRRCQHPLTATDIPFQVSYFLSSSSARSLSSQSRRSLACLLKVLSRGGAPMHRLGFLPFYCFGGRGIFFPHSCSLARYRPTPTPPLPPSWAYSACSVTQQAEREWNEGSTASVSSLSLQPPVLLLFSLLLGVSAH